MTHPTRPFHRFFARLPLLVFSVLAALGVDLATGCERLVPRAGKVEFVDAPASGDLAPYVQGELAKARGEHRPLLVYVGATWCEPCQRFHRAAEAGLLDARIPGLRFLVFDLDRDRDRLRAAGYESQYIPLFALPRADGTASKRQIEGSIKGEGAVDEIIPRLQSLLASK